MTRLEKTELFLIVLTSIGIYLLGSLLPERPGIDRLLLTVSSLLLFQGLLRDLWLLYQNRNKSADCHQREENCVCLESTVGITGIIAGLVLLGIGFDKHIAMNEMTWSLLVTLILVIGFLIKDLVLEWNPIRIRRDTDHASIVVKWK